MSSKPESLAQVTGARDSTQSRAKRRRCAGKIATPVLVGFLERLWRPCGHLNLDSEAALRHGRALLL
jgi:hypothetical protein